MRRGRQAWQSSLRLPYGRNLQQGKGVNRRGVNRAVVGSDHRHDSMERRQGAVGKRVETVSRPQGPVRILSLGSLEIEEVRVLDSEYPQVGHLFSTWVKPHQVVEVPCAETSF